MKQQEIITRLSEIQSYIQRLSYNIGSSSETGAVPNANKPLQVENIERKKAIKEQLLQQIRVLENLLRVTEGAAPRRLRTYNPHLVECLIFQTETLIGMVSAYVIPLLEQKENNRR